jgi:hypothetical protein
MKENYQLFVCKKCVGKLPECPRIIMLRIFVFLGVAPRAWFPKTFVHAYLYLKLDEIKVTS